MAPSYLDELFSLDGEVAGIVGGAGELCGAIAEGFARAGARIAIVDCNPENAQRRVDALRAAGAEARFFHADATKKADLERVADEVVKAWGKITIAVNGAGVNSSTPFLDIADEEFQRILNINFKSVAFGCQVFGRRMIDQKLGGCILNFSSMAAIRPLSRVFTYSATKAAVLNLTLNLAREWAPLGVRVNALAPGFFPAEQNRRVLTPERVASIMAHTPMNRFGESRELIGATLFLCARKAGSFVTGCHLTVDGGFAAVSI
jgi:NAD(P)-dependent dehydrogenase (short-subunit alcohol dehydrogenase family)